MKNYILATGSAKPATFFKNMLGIVNYTCLYPRIYCDKINTISSIFMNVVRMRPPILRSAPEAESGDLPFNDGNIPANSAPSISAKDEYRKLCEKETSIPIFSRDWWLDATAGPDGWDVALAKINGRIIGSMPYVTGQRFRMKVINQPALTPRLGPWLLPGEGKIGTKLANEQKIMQSLINQLPPFDHFTQTWNPDLTNWLPFYWNGFNQTTKYTYVLSLLGDIDALWSGLDSARRKHCKRGTDDFKLSVRDDLPVDALIALHRMTLQDRKLSMNYSEDYIRRLDAACAKRNCRKILIVVNEEGRHCSGTYTVWDDNCAYALFKGSDPEMTDTGAPSLCQWESIKYCAQVSQKYDFLGNMNKTIEPYVRSFGTMQVPIFSISKTPSRLLRLRRGLQSAINKKA